jgi:hypothetical protein
MIKVMRSKETGKVDERESERPENEIEIIEESEMEEIDENETDEREDSDKDEGNEQEENGSEEEQEDEIYERLMEIEHELV